MKTARKPDETGRSTAAHGEPLALSVNMSVDIDINPLVDVVRRHVKLTPQATRLIKSDFARLLQHPSIRANPLNKPAAKTDPKKGSATGPQTGPETNSKTDPILSTQQAADLVGVSRPYIVARIESGDIALHQQVGNQRRVLKTAVLAWHRQEQNRRREALGQLGADLDSEIFAG